MQWFRDKKIRVRFFNCISKQEETVDDLKKLLFQPNCLFLNKNIFSGKNYDYMAESILFYRKLYPSLGSILLMGENIPLYRKLWPSLGSILLMGESTQQYRKLCPPLGSILLMGESIPLHRKLYPFLGYILLMGESIPLYRKSHINKAGERIMGKLGKVRLLRSLDF